MKNHKLITERTLEKAFLKACHLINPYFIQFIHYLLNANPVLGALVGPGYNGKWDS